MKLLGTQNLETERLILRKIKKEDAEIAYKNWCTSKEVSKYVMWSIHENVEVTKELYAKFVDEYNDPETFRWMVEIKETHDLVGTIDVSKKYLKFSTCGIGYCYSPKYWNKGYGTEALGAVIKYLFEECDAELIHAEFLENNPASGRVMQKNGMQFEGVLRSRIVDKDNIRNDLLSYSITKEEYVNNKK